MQMQQKQVCATKRQTKIKEKNEKEKEKKWQINFRKYK